MYHTKTRKQYKTRLASTEAPTSSRRNSNGAAELQTQPPSVVKRGRKKPSLKRKRKRGEVLEQEPAALDIAIQDGCETGACGGSSSPCECVYIADITADNKKVAMGSSDPRATTDQHGKKRGSAGVLETPGVCATDHPAVSKTTSGIPAKEAEDFSKGKKGKRKLLGDRVWKPGNGKQKAGKSNLSRATIVVDTMSGGLNRKRKRGRILSGIETINLDTVNFSGPLTRGMTKASTDGETTYVRVKKQKSYKIRGKDEVPSPAAGDTIEMLCTDVPDTDSPFGSSNDTLEVSREMKEMKSIPPVEIPNDSSRLKHVPIQSEPMVSNDLNPCYSKKRISEIHIVKETIDNPPKTVSPRITRGMKDRGLRSAHGENVPLILEGGPNSGDRVDEQVVQAVTQTTGVTTSTMKLRNEKKVGALKNVPERAKKELDKVPVDTGMKKKPDKTPVYTCRNDTMTRSVDGVSNNCTIKNIDDIRLSGSAEIVSQGNDVGVERNGKSSLNSRSSVERDDSLNPQDVFTGLSCRGTDGGVKHVSIKGVPASGSKVVDQDISEPEMKSGSQHPVAAHSSQPVKGGRKKKNKEGTDTSANGCDVEKVCRGKLGTVKKGGKKDNSGGLLKRSMGKIEKRGEDVVPDDKTYEPPRKGQQDEEVYQHLQGLASVPLKHGLSNEIQTVIGEQRVDVQCKEGQSSQAVGTKDNVTDLENVGFEEENGVEGTVKLVAKKDGGFQEINNHDRAMKVLPAGKHGERKNFETVAPSTRPVRIGRKGFQRVRSEAGSVKDTSLVMSSLGCTDIETGQVLKDAGRIGEMEMKKHGTGDEGSSKRASNVSASSLHGSIKSPKVAFKSVTDKKRRRKLKTAVEETTFGDIQPFLENAAAGLLINDGDVCKESEQGEPCISDLVGQEKLPENLPLSERTKRGMSRKDRSKSMVAQGNGYKEPPKEIGFNSPELAIKSATDKKGRRRMKIAVEETTVDDVQPSLENAAAGLIMDNGDVCKESEQGVARSSVHGGCEMLPGSLPLSERYERGRTRNSRSSPIVARGNGSKEIPKDVDIRSLEFAYKSATDKKGSKRSKLAAQKETVGHWSKEIPREVEIRSPELSYKSATHKKGGKRLTIALEVTTCGHGTEEIPKEVEPGYKSATEKQSPKRLKIPVEKPTGGHGSKEIPKEADVRSPELTYKSTIDKNGRERLKIAVKKTTRGRAQLFLENAAADLQMDDRVVCEAEQGEPCTDDQAVQEKFAERQHLFGESQTDRPQKSRSTSVVAEGNYSKELPKEVDTCNVKKSPSDLGVAAGIEYEERASLVEDVVKVTQVAARERVGGEFQSSMAQGGTKPSRVSLTRKKPSRRKDPGCRTKYTIITRARDIEGKIGSNIEGQDDVNRVEAGPVLREQVDAGPSSRVDPSHLDNVDIQGFQTNLSAVRDGEGVVSKTGNNGAFPRIDDNQVQNGEVEHGDALLTGQKLSDCTTFSSLLSDVKELNSSRDCNPVEHACMTVKDQKEICKSWQEPHVNEGEDGLTDAVARTGIAEVAVTPVEVHTVLSGHPDSLDVPFAVEDVGQAPQTVHCVPNEASQAGGSGLQPDVPDSLLPNVEKVRHHDFSSVTTANKSDPITMLDKSSSFTMLESSDYVATVDSVDAITTVEVSDPVTTADKPDPITATHVLEPILTVGNPVTPIDRPSSITSVYVSGSNTTIDLLDSNNTVDTIDSVTSVEAEPDCIATPNLDSVPTLDQSDSATCVGKSDSCVIESPTLAMINRVYTTELLQHKSVVCESGLVREDTETSTEGKGNVNESLIGEEVVNTQQEQINAGVPEVTLEECGSKNDNSAGVGSKLEPLTKVEGIALKLANGRVPKEQPTLPDPQTEGTLTDSSQQRGKLQTVRDKLSDEYDLERIISLQERKQSTASSTEVLSQQAPVAKDDASCSDCTLACAGLSILQKACQGSEDLQQNLKVVEAQLGQLAPDKPSEGQSTSEVEVTLTVSGGEVGKRIVIHSDAKDAHIQALEVHAEAKDEVEERHSDAKEVHSKVEEVHSEKEEVHSELGKVFSKVEKVQFEVGEVHSEVEEVHSVAKEGPTEAKEVLAEGKDMHSAVEEVNPEAEEMHTGRELVHTGREGVMAEARDDEAVVPDVQAEPKEVQDEAQVVDSEVEVHTEVEAVVQEVQAEPQEVDTEVEEVLTEAQKVHTEAPEAYTEALDVDVASKELHGELRNEHGAATQVHAGAEEVHAEAEHPMADKNLDVTLQQDSCPPDNIVESHVPALGDPPVLMPQDDISRPLSSEIQLDLPKGVASEQMSADPIILDGAKHAQLGKQILCMQFPEQKEDGKTQSVTLEDIAPQRKDSDRVKASSISKKRKARIGNDSLKEPALQQHKRAWDSHESGARDEDSASRVYSKRKRFLLPSTAIESGGMRIRPRPLDPYQSIPIFLEGRDKDFYEFDGGSFYRWIQQQEEAKLKKLALDPVDGVREGGVSSSATKLSLVKKHPIFIPLCRKLPEEQQTQGVVQRRQVQYSKPGMQSSFPSSQPYVRHTKLATRTRGHALGGSFSTIPSVYDMDNEDDGWLQGYNITLKQSGPDQILSEDTFEQLIEVFEREFYRLYQTSYNSFPALSGDQCEKGGASGHGVKHLEVENSQRGRSRKKANRDCATNSKHQENEEGMEAQRNFAFRNTSEDCCICNGGENSDFNPVHRCQICSIKVHRSCYGICETEGTEFGHHAASPNWCCRKCEAVVGGRALPSISCAICCKSGGAMKATVDPSKWAHVACALYTNETFFVDPEAMEPIDGLSAVETRVKKQRERCGLCGAREGSCVRCSSRGCRAPFHISCGVLQGASFELRHTKQLVVGVRSFCPRHAAFFSVANLDESVCAPSAVRVDPAELLPAVSTESSETLEMGQARPRGVKRTGDAIRGARWPVKDTGYTKHNQPESKSYPKLERKRSGPSYRVPCSGGIIPGGPEPNSNYISDKDVHEFSKTLTRSGSMLKEKLQSVNQCLVETDLSPTTAEGKLEFGAVSSTTSGSSIYLPLAFENEHMGNVTTVADEGDPATSVAKEKKDPSEGKSVTQEVDTSSPVPESALTEVVSLKETDSCRSLPRIETLDTNLAPPQIVQAVYSFWQTKRSKVKGPILHELKQLQAARLQGIFNKVVQRSKDFLPVAGHVSPPRVPATRRPRSSCRDPVLLKISELKQQLEMLRTIAGNVVRREQLKREDQKLLYESAQQKLLLAREDAKSHHCHWCENTQNLLSCSSCAKTFCFRCFKHRRGYGVKGWIAASKLSQYVCNFCLGFDTQESWPVIGASRIPPAFSEPRSTCSGEALVSGSLGDWNHGLEVNAEPNSGKQVTFLKESRWKLDSLRNPHGSGSSSRDTASILSPGRGKVMGSGQAADGQTVYATFAAQSTIENSRAVKRAVIGQVSPSGVNETDGRESRLQLEPLFKVDKKVRKRRAKPSEKQEIRANSVMRTRRIKKLARSSSFVYGSDGETTVSESEESRQDKKTVKLSDLRDKEAKSQCTKILAEGNTGKGLHPFKFGIRLAPTGKLILRRHGVKLQQ